MPPCSQAELLWFAVWILLFHGSTPVFVAAYRLLDAISEALLEPGTACPLTADLKAVEPTGEQRLGQLRAGVEKVHQRWIPHTSGCRDQEHGGWPAALLHGTDSCWCVSCSIAFGCQSLTQVEPLGMGKLLESQE